MHEVFLTAVVPDADLERAKALLQGLSSMTAYSTLQRVLYFAGPPQPRGLAVKRQIPTPVSPQQGRLWSELHQQMSRQSFVLQARYPLQHSDFGRPLATPGSDAGGPANPFTYFKGTPGTLRWTDIPDPTPGGSGAGAGGIGIGPAGGQTGGNRLVMQRKKIDIADTRNIPAVLQDNNHKFKAELVEESFVFFTNNTEYALVRYHKLPTNGAVHVATVPLAALPSWEDVVRPTTTLDPAGQWLLFVRRYVLDDTAPEKMNKAVEELEAVRAQLAGVFAFRPVDRRAHDTRIERPVNNMPAPLPQKVRA